MSEVGIEEEESSDLPLISVTGYATPRFMVHPSTPKKVIWDVVVGVLIVYRCGWVYLFALALHLTLSSLLAFIFFMKYFRILRTLDITS